MRIINGLLKIKNPLVSNICVIGNFDCIHFGHEQILNNAYKISKKKDKPFNVLTFYPNIQKQIHKKNEGSVFSFYQKMSILKEKKVDNVILIRPFDRITSYLPECFIQKILVQKLNVETLIVGKDFKFGRDRLGNVKDLTNQHFKLFLSRLHTYTNNIKYSTSFIKEKIQEGSIKEIKKHINYRVVGKVKKCNQLGRKIGFPTMNLCVDHLFPLKFGVYIGEVRFIDSFVNYPAILYIGRRPTVHSEKDSRVMLEVHVLNQPLNNKYGEKIEVNCLEFLRSEVKFKSINLLVQQIKKDIQKASLFFKRKIIQ